MEEASTRLLDYKALIFDVYGTLMDWESGIYAALEPLLLRYEGSRKWSRKEALLAFGSVETDIQAQNPDMLYRDVLAKTHEVLEERLKALCGQQSDTLTLEGGSTNVSTVSASTSAAPISSDAQDTGAHKVFGDSIKYWPIFPDALKALHFLSRHFKLVVLSNVDRTSFEYTHAVLSEGPSPKDTSPYLYPDPNPNKYWHPRSTSRSNSPFSLILTAQDTGCYKPALGGFQTALECIQSNPDLLGGTLAEGEDVKGKVLSVAQSLTHDHVPANRLGLKSVWIDRQSAVTCNELPGGRKWTWRFETLQEMADAVEKESTASSIVL